ncbi:nicotinate-nucleotide pyrophosphorylase [Pontibacillus halophilus JSM 076056 = DSM 19796]|uniref:Probable nicotinate-nucleotide pyrophosphorylase [carboxylating] n=1 Tax=Pontibacillus halophilus JSM 076056 = DSM 19796 TaxID=1385510 RepID=A0A0A5GP48_9BACI|nr:carboxylating nicotinate-nucleotide diphosphorylase [Pontibacillus halophilus]KGX93774.1 nicotinate-nucleotide pyrophosphorylase [Pontibacillus halophilus JSM 076056 = DSM 19796]
MNPIQLRQQLQSFFLEDLGDGDRTSEAMFHRGDKGTVHFIVKDSGIFFGADVLRIGYETLDPSIEVELMLQDGDRVRPGDTIAIARGSLHSLLAGERVILNLLQHASGIATKTNQAVQLLNNDHTRICDTRKTTPGLRMIERAAVRAGGGYNHRNGLYDGVMIKDNHIALAGSIRNAVVRVREHIGHMIKIEVETESMEQVQEAVQAEVDVIMFDNQTPDMIIEGLKHIPSHIITEASGGIQLVDLAAYSATGVDYISIGALTHSVNALDMSVDVLD